MLRQLSLLSLVHRSWRRSTWSLQACCCCTSHPGASQAGDDVSGLLLDLGRVLAFNEELMDVAAAVNDDAPRREWTPAAVRNIGRIGGKLLHFAADKAGVLTNVPVVPVHFDIEDCQDLRADWNTVVAKPQRKTPANAFAAWPRWASGRHKKI